MLSIHQALSSFAVPWGSVSQYHPRAYFSIPARPERIILTPGAICPHRQHRRGSNLRSSAVSGSFSYPDFPEPLASAASRASFAASELP